MNTIQTPLRIPGQRGSPRRVPVVLLIIIGWLALAVGLGAAGVFDPPGGTPPVAIGVAFVVPPLLVVALLILSSRFRDWARSLDLRFLTLLQSWRTAGLAFLALQTAGALPATFATPAGTGDLIIGVTAPLVAVYLIGGGRLARLGFFAWTAFGVLDLVSALALGILHSDSAIGVLAGVPNTDLLAHLPMSLIPTFGVPLTLALHAVSLVAASGPAWQAAPATTTAGAAAGPGQAEISRA